MHPGLDEIVAQPAEHDRADFPGGIDRRDQIEKDTVKISHVWRRSRHSPARRIIYHLSYSSPGGDQKAPARHVKRACADERKTRRTPAHPMNAKTSAFPAHPVRP